MYFKNNGTALIFLLAMLAVAPIKAQVAFGDAAKFNDGWLFRLTDDSAIVRTDYDDSGWRKLSLPHDWSIEGQLSPTLASCTGYLPGGIGWYTAAVLPLDEALEAALLRRGSRKRCAVCGAFFFPKSNRGKYCPDCAGRMKRINAAKRKRKQREKCHALGHFKPA